MTTLPPRVLLPVAGVPPADARDSSLVHLDRAALPSGPFEIIYADPPWHYYGDPAKDQAAGKHYPLLRTDEIARLPVREITALRSVLFLWAKEPTMGRAARAKRARRTGRTIQVVNDRRGQLETFRNVTVDDDAVADWLALVQRRCGPPEPATRLGHAHDAWVDATARRPADAGVPVQLDGNGRGVPDGAV